MRAIAMLALGGALAGCSVRDDEPKFVCSDDERIYPMTAIRSERNVVLYYEGVDDNGLPIKVDSTNSKEWDCRDLEKTLADLMKARDASRAACDRITNKVMENGDVPVCINGEKIEGVISRIIDAKG